MQLEKGGARVAAFSRNGTKAWFCLFRDGKEQQTALQKSGDWFAGLITGVVAGDHYGYRVAGPWVEEQGYRFDQTKLLLDPFATRLSAPFSFNPLLTKRGVDTAAIVPKGIVEDDLTELRPREITNANFIYELGVRSFTRLHPDVLPEQRGTVAALAHPSILKHLKAIGADTVELMPLHTWIDERHLPPLGLHNAWGYNPVQFMAPDPRLCPGGWRELRHTVATLHDNGIQVVLDVVFNHSGESDLLGPTICLRGFDNAVYYAQTGGVLYNDTGCGNTLALNAPPVSDMALTAMRFLVLKCGIDGFRFDLGTVLGRTDTGFHADAPFIKAITDDPLLGSRILIAEPWDVGPGGYRLGNFPSRWREWNDQYRDGVRRFWRGDAWSANALATRICGSSDIFVGRTPSCSVNFLAAHDGFTLRDVTLYSAKQNKANGENNLDGNSHEVTWPGGNVRALLATLFLSRGTIMLTAGDEFGRTQKGNNNAYAQDNDLTWLNWSQADQELIGYISYLKDLRTSLGGWLEDRFVTSSEATWFRADGKAMDWTIPQDRFVGLCLKSGKSRLALAFNGSEEAAPFLFAPTSKKRWTRIFSSNSADEGKCPAQSVSVFEES